MSTHTPGPWKAVKSDRNQFAWDVIGAPGIVPTIARLGLVDPNEHTVKANAYLIAAAPAMLEALKLARFALLSMPDDVKAHLPGNVLPAMQQAIRLAEGKGTR